MKVVALVLDQATTFAATAGYCSKHTYPDARQRVCAALVRPTSGSVSVANQQNFITQM